MGKTFAVVSQKGGSGKTTTALNLSAAFAQRKLRTLLIDLDPQGGASFGLGIKSSSFDYGISDLLAGKVDIREITLSTENPYLRFIPPGKFSNVFEIDRFFKRGGRLSILRHAILSIRDECDVIIFDTPPGENSLVVNALNCSDSVIIPLQCEPLALRTLPQILRLIREVKLKFNPALEIEGVLLTMYDVRYAFTEQVSEHVWKNFPRELVFETIIPRREDFSKAFMQGRPVVFENPLSPASLAYLQLADEIISKLPQELSRTENKIDSQEI